MSRAGIHQANNTSGVPGVRARWRQGRWGRPQLGLDVTYYDRDGQRRSTTLPPTPSGMRRALQLREATIGSPLRISAKRALATVLGKPQERIKKS